MLQGIKGADGRYYVLDLVRITPRDTNYDDFLAEASKKGDAAAESDAASADASATAGETPAAAASATATGTCMCTTTHHCEAWLSSQRHCAQPLPGCGWSSV